MRNGYYNQCLISRLNLQMFMAVDFSSSKQCHYVAYLFLV